MNYENAFPDRRGSEGMTKREYFASAILQGMLAGRIGVTDTVPETAVRLADLLIEELKKEPKP